MLSLVRGSKPKHPYAEFAGAVGIPRFARNDKLSRLERWFSAVILI